MNINFDPRGISHFAEDILPGHPDRLADAVAESLVDWAVGRDPDALAGVEVAVHREIVFVTGRMAWGNSSEPELPLDDIVREVYRAAGYTGPWRLEPGVAADLEIGPLGDEERSVRGFSDDQNIVVGYAGGTSATGFLPPAVWASRRMKEALMGLQQAHSELLGPDGKVWVWLRERAGSFSWERLNVSIQHRPGLQYSGLFALLLADLERAAAGLDGALQGLAASWRPELLRLNGAGEFSCGGPRGDNGLSGKKLVVDHYGPGVPIGGGAICGKDPHKVDRVGALRARQIAVRLLAATGGRGILTNLAYLPGRDSPEAVQALADGLCVDPAAVRGACAGMDLSIGGTFRQLDLGAVRWVEVLGGGYFGQNAPWES